MAITYKFEDVVNVISRLIPRIVESDSAAVMCNVAIYEIWKRYDWRESLKVLPAFYLIPGRQDHGAPAVAVPSDMFGLRQAYLVRLNSNPVYRQALAPIKDLGLTYVKALPTAIGYNPATLAWRVHPRVPDNIGTPDWCIQGEYKKRPTAVTSSTLSSTFLPFDDVHFNSLVEVFKWAGWSMSGDQRAGGVQGNAMVGQLALAHAAIEMMAQTEDLELGNVTIAPSEALAPTSKYVSNYGRIFGV